MHDLAVMLAALAGPAEPGELAGEAAARAAFTRVASPARICAAAGRPARRGRSRRRVRGRVRLAAALVAAAAGLGSTAAHTLPGVCHRDRGHAGPARRAGHLRWLPERGHPAGYRAAVNTSRLATREWTASRSGWPR
jgi:hypothetical protein